MARQPLIAGVALLVGSCTKPEPYAGAFDVPTAVAVLQPEIGGPFDEPVGLVANGHGGQIVPLALKQGRFLTDDPTVAFLRTHQLATGDDRLLTSIAVRAPSVDEVTAWAGDVAFEKLLRVPWIVDCAEQPDDHGPCAEAVGDAPVESRAYFEVLEQSDGAILSNIQVRTGWTTTETWTLEYDGSEWILEGSRSGRQPDPVVPGRPYAALDRRLELTLRDAAPQPGDRFVIKTRSGLSEYDVGGAPLALSLTPDQSLLALIVHDRALDRPVLRWFDPVERVVTEQVALPADAWPHRLSWSEDGRLLVADRVRAAVYEVDPGAAVATEISVPWPTLDVASLGELLYVVPLDGLALWLVDRSTGELLDVNASVPDDQGMIFTAPVRGIEAMPREYLMPEVTEDLVRVTGRAVAISLATGDVVFAHEQTGCLVQDALGPRTELLDGSLGLASDYEADLDQVVGPPILEESGSSGRHVVVNTCAGIAKEEQWDLRYDQPLGVWQVEGTLSGPQAMAALEDERYLSDGGEVSFTIRSGATPSRDGWTILFVVEEGVAAATGDIDGDDVRDVSVPVSGDPVYFYYRVGLPGPVGDVDGDDGFYPVDVRPFVLIPGASSNEVGRVDPQEAEIEIGWD